MARPREFDPDTVIAAAVSVFWELGYEDASLPALLKGTGLSRGSLYKAFKGKQTLFIQALHAYTEQQVWPAIAILKGETGLPGRERIRAVFESIPNATRSGERRGCLLCTAAAGTATNDPEIAKVIDDILETERKAFDTALQDSGLVIEGLAEALIAQYIGLRTLQRSGTEAEDLQSSVNALMSLVER